MKSACESEKSSGFYRPGILLQSHATAIESSKIHQGLSSMQITKSQEPSFKMPTFRQCDEKRPQCSHCTRHGVVCEYPSLTTRVYNPIQQKPSTPLTRRVAQGDPKPSLPSPELGGMRVLELRLMHHWRASVRCGLWLFRKWLLNMNLSFTLLAIGAAHRASLLPEEANALRPWHRPVTAKLDGSTSESVCLNAVLISLFTLFLRSEPSTEPYEPPLLWLSMARGIRTVLKEVYHQLVKSNSRLCPLLLAQPTIWSQGSYKGPDNPFHFLLVYRRDEEEMNEESEKGYSGTIAYLERLYMSVQTNEPDWIIRKLFNGFSPVVPSEFLDFVYEKRPRALAILAYFFALGKRVENIWWLRGIPEREVRGINSIMPLEWKWTIVWPLNLISEKEHTPKGESTVPQVNRNLIDALF
ncbi:uncharacterized protein N7498_001157 [Penicillium cinerascens]|uniref:Zn(2)-C6 fungal-type domain-containing protein n=1 Tax=Penicillium cinerascens TaxID=70096 RepID=A0A9W9NG00_9EURO|nr:uncharacterized protein N7498_001157 [Penicillium cinerascens]KAJ5219058.1 hypothetical protein N7498_001157 [Penicillium cinerascens]